MGNEYMSNEEWSVFAYDLKRNQYNELLHSKTLRTAFIKSNLTPKTRYNKLYLTAYLMDQNQDALSQLVQANEPLVKKVVSYYKPFLQSEQDIEDLIQEGRLGLVTAVNLFDFSKKYGFTWFANTCIRNAVLSGLEKLQSVIYLPHAKYALIHHLYQLEKEHFFRDTAQKEAYFSKKLGISNNAVRELLLIQDRFFSPDTLSHRPELSQIPFDQPLEFIEEWIKSDLEYDLEAILYALSDREENILRLRYGLEPYSVTSIKEIASIFGVTPARIRTIHDRAIKKLQTKGPAFYLQQYFYNDPIYLNEQDNDYIKVEKVIKKYYGKTAASDYPQTTTNCNYPLYSTWEFYPPHW